MVSPGFEYEENEFSVGGYSPRGQEVVHCKVTETALKAQELALNGTAPELSEIKRTLEFLILELKEHRKA